MNQKQIRAAVEAMLLCLWGPPLAQTSWLRRYSCRRSAAEAALEAGGSVYTREDSGLCLLHLNTRWQLATKNGVGRLRIRRLLRTAAASRCRWGPAAMETLTVIAYNQPVSRAFIEQVRGVDSSSSVSSLLEKGLIREAGRLDLPGRRVSFRTTDTFFAGVRRFPVWRIYRRCTARKQNRMTRHRRKVRGKTRMGSIPRRTGRGAAVCAESRRHPAFGGAGACGAAAFVPLLCGSVLGARCAHRKSRRTGITFPVFQYPKPEPPPAPENPEPPKGFGKVKAKFAAWRAERKRKKPKKRPGKKPPPTSLPGPAKGKITLEIICTMLRGCGQVDEGGVRGPAHHKNTGAPWRAREDPAAAARDYGKLQAVAVSGAGRLDRFPLAAI